MSETNSLIQEPPNNKLQEVPDSTNVHYASNTTDRSTFVS